MEFSNELEEFIEAILTDGKIDDKERKILRKKAEREGLDPDEIEIIVDSRLQSMLKNIVKEKKKGVKCPHCGAIIETGKSVCPDCGWAINDMAQNSSALKLAKLLQGVPSENEKGFAIDDRANIIDTFPVPNSKSDLLEFLALCKSKGGINSTGEGEAYWNKYKECIDKARLSFSSDRDFDYYFKYYEEQMKRTPVRTYVIRGFIIFYVLLFAIFLLYMIINL